MFTTQSNLTLAVQDVDLRYTVSGFFEPCLMMTMTNLSIAALSA